MLMVYLILGAMFAWWAYDHWQWKRGIAREVEEERRELLRRGGFGDQRPE